MTNKSRRTLLFGGPVVTQNARRETHEALVLEGGKVLATGELGDMRTLAGARAHEVDVQGASVLPGLIDNHPHFLHFGTFEAGAVSLYDARSHDEILARIRERTAVTPRGQWVLATPVGEPAYFIRRSWRDLPEGRLPNRQELDSVAPDHPVWIQAYAPRVPNIGAMNSLALRMLEFNRDLPDRVGDVWIEKDERGELTGIFHGNVTTYYNGDEFWMTRVVARVLSVPNDAWYWGAMRGQATAAERGVTAAYEGHAMDPEHIAAYQRIRDEGRMTLRVLAALEAAPHALDSGMGLTDAKIRAKFALAKALTQITDPMYRVNGMTLCPDGPVWSAFMRSEKPYKDAYGRPTHGRAFYERHIQREAIEYSLKHDVRLNMVMGGLQNHDEFLQDLDPLLDGWDVRSREWIMQHNVFIKDETIKRYADLNFHLTTTLSFCWGKGDMYRERLGEQALDDLLPIGKMFASGANVGLGSDWGPASAFEHMALAETREMAASGCRHDKQGHPINRQQAFDGWTVNNAKMMHWEGIGAIKPGHHADLTIVDRNPLTCNLADLPQTRVLKTVLGGKEVFDAGSLSGLNYEE